LSMGFTTFKKSCTSIFNSICLFSNKAGSKSFWTSKFIIIYFWLRMIVWDITPPSTLSCIHLTHYHIGIGRVFNCYYIYNISRCSIFPSPFTTNKFIYIIFCK